MKTILYTGMIWLLVAGTCMAQNTKKMTHTTTSSTSAVTISVTENDGSSTSISINDSDAIYHFTASFENQMHSIIVEYLGKKLDKKFLVSSNTKGAPKEWKRLNGNELVWNVKLKEKSLKIFLDKESSTTKAYQELQQVGEELSEMLSGVD